MKKKLFFAIAMLMCTAGVMAQTADEKAAAKAAKAELKAKQKAADTQLTEAMKVSGQIQDLELANAAEMALGKNAKQATIDENNKKIVDLSYSGLAPLEEALGTGYVADGKKYEAYMAQQKMSNYILNNEIGKYQKKEDVDLTAFGNCVKGLADACQGEIKYGNAKDETQSKVIAAAKQTLPKCKTFYAYLFQFNVQAKNLDGASKAYDAYKNFAATYPEAAEDEEVKNPSNPNNFFAYNLFCTAYNDKNFEVMDKYRDEAKTYNNGQNADWCTVAKANILKEQGKMDEWVAEEWNIISQNSDNEIGQNSMSQLMVYYNNDSKEKADAYTTELVTKYPESKTANYIRGFSLFSQEKYQDAYNSYKKAAEIDPTYGDAIYQSGLSLYEIAIKKAASVSGKKTKSAAEAAKITNEVKGLFKQAMPILEKYKDMAPDQTDRWAGPLKTIYTNLGMSAKAAEMQKLLGY